LVFNLLVLFLYKILNIIPYFYSKRQYRYCMIRFILVCFLTLGLTGYSHAQGLSPQVSSDLQYQLDSFRTANGLVGVSASVRVNNQGSWNGVTGVSYPGRPISSDMQFGIGSNTKLFAGVILLKLVELQMLRLEDSVYQYMGPLPNIHPHITLRQLLNHSSGLADVNEVVGYGDSILSNPIRVFTPDEVLLWVGPPAFAPGMGWKYSNTNYILAARIAELASGKSFHQLLDQYILSPLQLDSTYLGHYEFKAGEIAHPWQNGQDNVSIPRTALHTVAWAAGAMLSTASEMTQWYQGLMNGQILNAQSMQEMTSFTGSGNYGIGLIQDQINGRTVWLHGGNIYGGYNSAMLYDPVKGVSVCVLVNQNPGQAYNLAVNLLKTIWNSPLSSDVEMSEKVAVSVYPNPGHSEIHFSMPVESVKIYEASGKLVLESRDTILDTQALPVGYYIIEVLKENHPTRIPWVKQ
jgi:D-alanyl-D-alanine carboxypeptidase